MGIQPTEALQTTWSEYYVLILKNCIDPEEFASKANSIDEANTALASILARENDSE